MRTNTIPEKVFDSSEEAWNYVENVYRLLRDKFALALMAERGLNELFKAFAIELESIPLYHDLELSVREKMIRVYFQISIRTPEGPSRYRIRELSSYFLIGKIDNGYLSYNPAEGF